MESRLDIWYILISKLYSIYAYRWVVCNHHNISVLFFFRSSINKWLDLDLAWGRNRHSGLQLQLDGIFGICEPIDTELQWNLGKTRMCHWWSLSKFLDTKMSHKTCHYFKTKILKIIFSHLSPCRAQSWSSGGSLPKPASSSRGQIACQYSSLALSQRAGRQKDLCCLCYLCWTWKTNQANT